MTAGDVEVVRGSLNSRKAVALDGTDDYVLADAHAVARVAANDTVGTYSAWIFLDTNNSESITILSAGDNDNTNEYFLFGKFSTGKIQAKLVHGGATQFDVRATNEVLTAKKWYHVAVVQTGTRCNLYLDGKIIAMTDNVATDLTFWYDELTLTDKFAIGVTESNGTHTGDWSGMISDVKYWDLALTADQILTDYKNLTADPEVTAHLQFHIDFDEDATDAGLGADDGTPTGHAYLCGWGSEWSRQIELNALVADTFESLSYDSAGIMTTLIMKAA